MGLIFSLILIVVSVTGSLLVMHTELGRILERDRHTIPQPPASATLADVNSVALSLQNVAPAHFRLLRLEPGVYPDSAHKLVYIHEDRVRRWSAFFNPYTGEVLWTGDDQDLLKPWLLHLHEQLHAGPAGFIIVGLAAFALTLLGLSGAWIARKKLPLLLRTPVRLRSGWRAMFSDLHQCVGLVSIYFTLVLGITGMWFAYLIIPGLWTVSPKLPQEFELQRLTNVRPAIESAMRRFPIVNSQG